MASEQSKALSRLYDHWTESLAAEGENSLPLFHSLLEHWGDLTEEPRGVDYIETICGGVPAIWCHPKGASRLRAQSNIRRHWWNRSRRSEEHTSELQSLMRISYAVFCLQTKKNQ